MLKLKPVKDEHEYYDVKTCAAIAKIGDTFRSAGGYVILFLGGVSGDKWLLITEDDTSVVKSSSLGLTYTACNVTLEVSK